MKLINYLNLAIISLIMVAVGLTMLRMKNLHHESKVELLIAPHNRIDDCWIANGEKIYDITKFVGTYEGDRELLMKWCGKESTILFEAVDMEMKNRLNNYLKKE